MKASFISTLALAAVTNAAYNVSTSATEYSTSTVYATSVYTITSCAATVTDCPARMGQVTTDVVSLYTTICPVSSINLMPTIYIDSSFRSPLLKALPPTPLAPQQHHTQLDPLPVTRSSPAIQLLLPVTQLPQLSPLHQHQS